MGPARSIGALTGFFFFIISLLEQPPPTGNCSSLRPAGAKEGGGVVKLSKERTSCFCRIELTVFEGGGHGM